jgi:hypothetical protein
MVLYLVGLGLGDEKDVTVRGLEAIKQVPRVPRVRRVRRVPATRSYLAPTHAARSAKPYGSRRTHPSLASTGSGWKPFMGARSC